MPAQRSFQKTLVSILGFLIIALVLYLVILPFYPILKYNFLKEEVKVAEQKAASSSRTVLAQEKRVEENYSGNRLVIDKIGVNTSIVEGENENALNRGAWRAPESSTPSAGGNTVITGHRFKYLPPNNLTFYLLDKLVAGDTILVIWNDKEYWYLVSETKIVPPEAMEILNPTDKPILTLFTCDPIWSQTNRLVVISEPVEPSP
ncbi:MAG: class E sortase [Patescibacteria group bacterium]